MKFPNQIDVQPDTSRVLMSDVLKGNVPELEGDVTEGVPNNRHVVVIAEKVTAVKKEGLVGILRGVFFDTEPEISFRIELDEAMGLVEAPALSFNSFELHHGERIVKMPGPFIVKAARIDDISAQDQLCTISLHLMKQQR